MGKIKDKLIDDLEFGRDIDLSDEPSCPMCDGTGIIERTEWFGDDDCCVEEDICECEGDYVPGDQIQEKISEISDGLLELAEKQSLYIREIFDLLKELEELNNSLYGE